MTISRRTFGLSAICAAGSFASVSTVRATEQSSGIATADLPQGENATPALVQSIESAVAAGQPRLQLPEGEFHFWPEGTAQRFLHISNNDDEVNNVVVLLDGVDNFHIEGQNTRLIFHGRVTPFVLLNCSDVQITGVTIDWEVPFHCEATVSKVSPDGKQVELDFHEGFSFKVKDNEFYFAGEGFEAKGIKNILEFDADRRETRYQVFDNYLYSRLGGVSRRYRVTQLDERRVRFDMLDNFRSVPVAGNVVIVMPVKRLYPAIFVEDCRRVTVKGVTINHSGCMGLICQTSSTISLIDSAVVPSGNRHVSTCVDATHFVNCSGSIHIENCDFSHHIDDALNVHGIYVRIKSRLDNRRLAVELSEPQQRGVRCVRAGDLIALMDDETVAKYFTGTVHGVDWEDERDAVITLDSDLPDTVQEGDVIDVLNRQSNVLFRNNRISKNRARGILLKTLGELIVEDNYFHTPGAAIFIPGGVTHWYESSPTSYVLIRNNVFDHCKYGVWSDAVIAVICRDPGGTDPVPPFHGTVVITDNEFRSHFANQLVCNRTEQVVFKRNRIEMNAYHGFGPDLPATIKLEKVGRISVSDNHLVGGQELRIINER